MLGLGEEAVQRGFVALATVFHQTLEELEERPGSLLTGVPTGFIDLDRISHGLNRGNLQIIAGRPGMGKTSFALNIAQHVAIKERRAVGIFSLEMGQQELALRILCSEADISFRRLRAGRVSQKEWTRIIQTVRANSESPLFIDDSANPTLLEVASKARPPEGREGPRPARPRLFCSSCRRAAATRTATSRYAISRGLKQLAKERTCRSSRCRSSPANPSGGGRPLARIARRPARERQHRQQDADLVAFIYRDEMYNPTEDNKGPLAELIIAKYRNGETGTVDLVFFGETTSFKSRDCHGEPPSAPF